MESLAAMGVVTLVPSLVFAIVILSLARLSEAPRTDGRAVERAESVAWREFEDDSPEGRGRPTSVVLSVPTDQGAPAAFSDLRFFLEQWESTR